MKHLVLFTLLTLFVSNVMATGMQEFEVEIPPDFTSEEYKPDLQNWRNSLFKGLGYVEENINEGIFLKTDIPLSVNGHESIGQVYQNKNNKNQFYVLASNTIVDFEKKLVGTMGVSGISRHPTPSGRMVIIVAPGKSINLLGVTLDFTVKVQVRPPTFIGNKVKYEWRAW